jgi:diacylglycerol kinase (ATP)
MTATTGAPRYALICNPTAQSGRGRRAWSEIQRRLDAAGASFVLLPSEYPGHAVALAAEQVERGTPIVVAVGGDGTINEVMEGLMQGVRAAGERPALGILYTGTSPDVCRYHRIPVKLDEAIATLLAEHCRMVDIGEIRYHHTAEQEPGAEFDRLSWFLCSVNLGMGASVAEGSNQGLRRYLGDTLGTMVSLIKTAVRFAPLDLSCHVDEQEVRLTQVLNLTIGKNPHIASGIRLGIDIQPDDGTLYLFAARGFSLLGFLGQLPRLYRGTFQDHPNNYWRQMQSFRCPTLPAANALEFDGDPRGYLPCSIRILPRALSLIVPSSRGGSA